MKSTVKNGIAASKGIAIAKVYKLEEFDLELPVTKTDDIDEEINNFNKALVKTLNQLIDLKESAMGKLSTEELEIFDAHKLIVADPELKTQVENLISSDKLSAFSATKQVTDTFVMIMEMNDDEYFKARAADIKDVRKRLMANILNKKLPNLSEINEEVIVVAEDLTPSETSQLNKEMTLGFATNIGGRTSHSAIMARSLEIPAIVGMKDILENVEHNDIIILDALEGIVIINPTEDEIKLYEKKKNNFMEMKKSLETLKNKETLSIDNHQVELVANIGTPNDIEGVLRNGAEGVGLYRTEFLYMDSNELPSEETQFSAYKKVLESMGEKPVVVRTLDIGGDKELSYLKFPNEMNPFLGYRAIRMCLDRDDIFRVQLRALLRASIFGNLKIMFPMIATIEEFRAAKEILLEEKEKLIQENISVSNDIEIGIMVEVPSTAVMADTFAKEVDFFSIGTNDLIQYTMACDRMSEKISYLYQPYNPAILRLVKNVIDAANEHGKWAGMCGEMASDERAITILLALGLHEFSMSASAILESRYLISNLSKNELEKHVDTILNLSTAKEVQEYVDANILK